MNVDSQSSFFSFTATEICLIFESLDSFCVLNCFYMFDLFCNVPTFTLHLQEQRIFYISMLSLIHPFYLLGSDAYFCQFIFF